MQRNVHNPERYEGESREQYKARRLASQQAVKAILSGAPVFNHIGHSRRPVIKAAGGIRHFKRQRYLAQHEGYAQRHPGMVG